MLCQYIYDPKVSCKNDLWQSNFVCVCVCGGGGVLLRLPSILSHLNISNKNLKNTFLPSRQSYQDELLPDHLVSDYRTGECYI